MKLSKHFLENISSNIFYFFQYAVIWNGLEFGVPASEPYWIHRQYHRCNYLLFQSFTEGEYLLLVSLATSVFLSCLGGFGTLLFRFRIIKHFTRQKVLVLYHVLTNGTVANTSVQTSKITLCCFPIERYLSVFYSLKKNLLMLYHYHRMVRRGI